MLLTLVLPLVPYKILLRNMKIKVPKKLKSKDRVGETITSDFLCVVANKVETEGEIQLQPGIRLILVII